MYRKITVKRIDDSGTSETEDRVIKEQAFTILINGKEVATLLCLPEKLEYLAVGFLSNGGILEDPGMITEMHLDPSCNYIDIDTSDGYNLPEEIFSGRIILPGCGRCLSFYNPRDAGSCLPVDSDLRIEDKAISEIMDDFLEKSILFRHTGGVHSAALYSMSDMCSFAEDIGRHNAVDKVTGECKMNKMPMDNMVLFTTGRVSSEIVIKAARNSMPVIVSHSAVTDLAVKLCDALSITLIGFSRGDRMNIYTGSNRIKKGGEYEKNKIQQCR